jgi:hypothetical protein
VPGAPQTYGLLPPAGTPPEIVKELNGALQDALASDLVKARIAADDREETKWSKVVEEAGAKER